MLTQNWVQPVPGSQIVGKTQKFRARENGGRAGKSFLPFFFLFALSQFSGPDYLRAWKRLNWVVPLISLTVREICFKQTSFYRGTRVVASRSIGCFLRVPLTFTPFCLRRFFKLECLTLILIPLPIAFYSNCKSPIKLQYSHQFTFQTISRFPGNQDYKDTDDHGDDYCDDDDDDDDDDNNDDDDDHHCNLM